MLFLINTISQHEVMCGAVQLKGVRETVYFMMTESIYLSEKLVFQSKDMWSALLLLFSSPVALLHRASELLPNLFNIY